MKKMKRNMVALLTVFLGIACIGAFSACKNGETSGDNSSTVEQEATLSLNVTSSTLTYGEVLELIPMYTVQSGATMVWSTSNDKVATVNDGTVEAVGKGSAVITVTYGKLSATCEVKVEFGDLQPTLQLAHIPEDALTLSRNSAYSLEASVVFNKRSYPCEIEVDVEDSSVLTYENGELKAVGTGETSVTVKGIWNEFTGALMQKTLSVTVFNDVVMTSKITVGQEETKITDTVELYMVSQWAGSTYETTADLEVLVSDSGEAKEAVIEIANGENLIAYANGTITALAAGEALLKASYVDAEGEQFETFVTVNVICPVAENTSLLELCLETDKFDAAAWFGSGVEITSAKQGDTPLILDNGALKNIVAAGDKTEDIEICTNKGGYLFTNVFVYDRAITIDNFASTFTLQYAQESAISGYYVLNEDLDLGATFMQSNVGNVKNVCFAGTFDGRGHKLTATVGTDGLFGTLGNAATIKNTHFEFTFPTTGEACGIARNRVFNDKNVYVTLENLYVTTTNYTTTSYAVMYNKPLNTIMKDVFVNITGITEEFTSVESGVAALFNLDTSLINGAIGQFEGDFQNVYAVTGTFVPMANGITPWAVTNRYVTYAKNDLEKLGKVTHGNTSSEAFNYCMITDKNASGSAQAALFGTNNHFYGAKSSVKNGGVSRYDTVEELKGAGVTKIGDWTVQ